MFNRLAYVSLWTMGSIIMGRAIQKVFYPWAKETWDYRQKYELYRQQQLEHLHSQIRDFLILMNEIVENARTLNSELMQQWNEYKKTLESYRLTLNEMDHDYAWIKTLSAQLSDATFLDKITYSAYSNDEFYKKEIVECELKSLKGLLMNRLYYSQGEII
jgi:predicted RNase H-like nuclease (RuvC/YqgF family)